MKRIPRFTRTVEFLKNHPEKVGFFMDKAVYIWSGEYGMFWRADTVGYTPNVAEAGVYPFHMVWGYLLGTGKEKRLKVQVVSDLTLKRLSQKYKDYVNEALHGTDKSDDPRQVAGLRWPSQPAPGPGFQVKDGAEDVGPPHAGPV
jgi:hypothetical protein